MFYCQVKNKKWLNFKVVEPFFIAEFKDGFVFKPVFNDRRSGGRGFGLVERFHETRFSPGRIVAMDKTFLGGLIQGFDR
jgi:hypothetical protein